MRWTQFPPQVGHKFVGWLRSLNLNLCVEHYSTRLSSGGLSLFHQGFNRSLPTPISRQRRGLFGNLDPGLTGYPRDSPSTRLSKGGLMTSKESAI